jgi:XTP/dITP diphosphohydrolase
MKKIYFISSNKGKVLEVKKMFSTVNIDVIQKNLGYPEIQADSLEEVACFGVKHVQERFNESFFLEDSGLFIEELKGFPGVYSKYVFYTIGCEGVLKLLDGFKDEKRKACFRSVFAYNKPNGKPLYFVGECLGRISKKPLGDHGFGYDPIFIPDNSDKTFAQMQTEEKNCFSHRGKSLGKLIEFIKKEKL